MMKRFVATMNDGSFINIQADKMAFDQETNMVMVYNGEDFVACAEMSAIIHARISEGGEYEQKTKAAG